MQKFLNFSIVPTEPFNEMFVEDMLMFKLDIPHNLNSIPLETDNFNIVCSLLTSKKNQDALHAKKVPPDQSKKFFQEMNASFEQGDPDEANFIIRKGIVPVAWLKMNGLQGKDTA